MAEIRLNADGSSVYAKANAEISKARSRWPNLVVADWRRTVAEAGADSAPWFVDGVHLTTTGQAEFALWVRQLVGGTGPIGGNYTSSWRFAPNQRIELQVIGQKVVGPDGVARTIPAGVSAVALNITAVAPAGRRVHHGLAMRRRPTGGVESQLRRRRRRRERCDRPRRCERLGVLLLQPADRVPRRCRRVVRRRVGRQCAASSERRRNACSTPATPSVDRGCGFRRAVPSRSPLPGVRCG